MHIHFKTYQVPLNNENGSALIVALFVLVLVSIIAISATNTSTIEQQIATNDHLIKIAFYNADGSLYGTSKLISRAINNSDSVVAGSGTNAPGISYLTTANDFYNQIAGYDVYDNVYDIDFNPGGINAQTDARRDHQGHVAGGGAEFSTGPESAGTTAIAIFYEINSTGDTNRQTTCDLTAVYRKLVGVPGGL